jgi:ABC-type nitrate/sulfonate/bicarbonate transport system substrate-binding protein
LEKGFYAKHGMPDMEVEKQASWGATRDNMALGTARPTASMAATSCAQGASLCHRQGDAEQPAAADVYAVEPE